MQFITAAERAGKKLLLSSYTLPDVYTELPDVFSCIYFFVVITKGLSSNTVRLL